LFKAKLFFIIRKSGPNKREVGEGPSLYKFIFKLYYLLTILKELKFYIFSSLFSSFIGWAQTQSKKKTNTKNNAAYDTTYYFINKLLYKLFFNKYCIFKPFLYIQTKREP